jgi:hypothetical protein
MLRKFAAIVAAGILGAMASSSRADSVVATLASSGNPPPADIVSFPGIGSVYAGLLNWSVVTTTAGSQLANTSSFSTYCIDTVDEIGVGGTYEFDLDSLSSDKFLSGTYNDNVSNVSDVSAIETLYTLSYGSSTLSDDAAAGFQAAVWNILTGVTLGLDNNAQSAYNADIASLDTQLQTGNSLIGYNVMALVADPSNSGEPSLGGSIPGYPDQGQDQALVVVPTFGSSPVPLPSTSMGGCVLLGLFGVGVAAKKRFSTAQ